VTNALGALEVFLFQKREAFSRILRAWFLRMNRQIRKNGGFSPLSERKMKRRAFAESLIIALFTSGVNEVKDDSPFRSDS
jgi:hypothetical protein